MNLFGCHKRPEVSCILRNNDEIVVDASSKHRMVGVA